MQKPKSPETEPVKRGRLRLAVGEKYFCVKRRLRWAFSGIKFARQTDDVPEHVVFSHATPLIRRLKGVDMYLQTNKITNLKVAAARLNGLRIAPGETFSYWKAIGRPTKRKGYLDGLVFERGGFKPGTGGGLCQMSNLIYWMALHTPLTVVERHRHGYDVFPDSDRTQPFGSGATCFYNYLDLMLRNDTDRIFQLEVEVTESELRGAWRSDQPQQLKYEVYEKEHMFQSEYWGGYTRHNVLYRRSFGAGGELISDELIAENHAIMMYSPLLPATDTVSE